MLSDTPSPSELADRRRELAQLLRLARRHLAAERARLGDAPLADAPPDTAHEQAATSDPALASHSRDTPSESATVPPTDAAPAR